MDYGSYLKETVGNLNKKSKTYQKQSDFKTSNRYVRGAILRTLAIGPLTKLQLCKKLRDIEKERVELQIEALLQENMLILDKRVLSLP